MYFSEKKSLKNCLWKLNQYDEQKSLTIYQKFSLSETLSRLLSIKNIEINGIEDFLGPTLKNSMTNPYKLLDMQKGVDIVYDSIVNKERICVFGDYDVDGVSSAALMKNFFDLINIQSIIYIPDRVTEGYGPNSKAFQKLKNEMKINLIVTVDCGISAFEACKKAKEIDLKVVITDHHLGDATLPEAGAVINPNRLDEQSEYKNLAGVGVAFLFLVALNKKLRENNFYTKNNIEEVDLLQFLDLVALGTICDVVPLTGLNRALVRQGLKIIHQRTNLGIKSLIDISGIDEEISTYHVGFILGPRINATGRIGESDLSSKLLYLKDSFECLKVAKNLDLYNTERQNIEKIILEEAFKQVELKELYKNDIIFVEGEKWHEGIIGIIASRIKDRFEKPTVVLSKLETYCRASCRSIHGVDIGSAIIEAKLKNIIKDGGGHAMAGGFSIEYSKIDKLKEFFINKLSSNINYCLNNKEREADLVLECKSLTINLANEIDKLGPFGAGNHKPKVILKDVVIIKSDLIGKNQNNLRLIICDDDLNHLSSRIISMYFRINKNDQIYQILSKKGQKVNLLGEININNWQGRQTVQFIVDDILV
ncbi:MAG: single-stranded-DNA-specific exonuclease RecJ [Rickettsiales bacterium]|nr:single-stranded-DNA-specific exonuclease RecJ [Rickettsiales bacterium]